MVNEWIVDLRRGGAENKFLGGWTMGNENSKIVDARGLDCPRPVIMTRRALAAADVTEVTAIVDDEVARDNIVKLAADLACSADVDSRGADYYIRITKPEQGCALLEQSTETVYLVSSDALGRGDDELGRLLMKNFFYALAESGGAGKVLLFINGGVRLTCQGSPIIDHLSQLEEDGAEVSSCGTCLDFYKLKESLQVGKITNMYSILEYLQQAPRVINF
jgi:selenium metabolism protein YedF